MIIDFKSFIFGFLIGCVILALVVLLCLFFINKRFVKKSIKAIDISNSDVQDIIKEKQNKVLKSYKFGVKNNIVLMQEISKELIEDIASYYYPNSKYPQYEISIDEALDLNLHITERLKGIVDTKVIGIIKNVRISQLIYILDVKDKIEGHGAYQVSKKYKLDKVFKLGYSIFNAASVSYWVRKLIYSSTLESTLRGVGLLTINIIGEEANQLYSRKVIDKQKNIMEKEITKLLSEFDASDWQETI